MSAASTPGPWIALKGVDQSDDMRCGVAAVRGELQYLVATVENGAPGDICDTEYANACLIAAAPELYEALVGIHKMLWGRPDIVNALRPLMGFAEAGISNQCAAALAKARGEH